MIRRVLVTIAVAVLGCLLASFAVQAIANEVQPWSARVTVDASAPGHPISELIYGVGNQGNEEMLASAGMAMLRWGGNHTTRYNWKLGNAWNAARDWKFQNVDYGIGPPELRGYAHDTQAAMCDRMGITMLLTVPTIGWVAKDRQSASSKELGADPKETSIPAPPEFMAEWVRKLHADGRNVHWFAMDNEPDIWNHTHSDIHPEPAGYDEILDRFLRYATAIKGADPQARITGPVSANVYYYFKLNSGAEDRKAHGNKEFVPWFLGKVAEHDRAAGRRTLDVLDLHFYPEPKSDEARIAAVRELYDRGHARKDGMRLELIPRMRRWIAQEYPGTGMGISEFSFGEADNVYAALAHGDALGVFAREGLSFACRWGKMPKGSALHTVYRLLRRPMDGAAGEVRFGEVYLPTHCDRDQKLGAYAAVNREAGRLTVLLVNRDMDAPGRISVAASGRPGEARVHLWSSESPSALAESRLEFAGTSMSVTVPAASIALVVFP